jgi:hypothetical protein
VELDDTSTSSCDRGQATKIAYKPGGNSPTRGRKVIEPMHADHTLIEFCQVQARVPINVDTSYKELDAPIFCGQVVQVRNRRKLGARDALRVELYHCTADNDEAAAS